MWSTIIMDIYTLKRKFTRAYEIRDAKVSPEGTTTNRPKRKYRNSSTLHSIKYKIHNPISDDTSYRRIKNQFSEQRCGLFRHTIKHNSELLSTVQGAFIEALDYVKLETRERVKAGVDIGVTAEAAVVFG
ncbi:hypothetical protein Hanom_Chr12g01114531 [Helianthus anomalus]